MVGWLFSSCRSKSVFSTQVCWRILELNVSLREVSSRGNSTQAGKRLNMSQDRRTLLLFGHYGRTWLAHDRAHIRGPLWPHITGPGWVHMGGPQWVHMRGPFQVNITGPLYPG